LKKLLFIILLTLSIGAKERIITLSPSLNEIVYALDMGKNVVGNTQYCQYPKETIALPKVGGYFSPSLEKIIALNPSLVLMQKNNQKLNSQLQKLKIKTKLVKIESLKSIKNSILELGKIFKKEKKANAIVDEIDHSIEELKGIIKNKKILIVFGHNTSLRKNIFVAGQNLYFEEIIVASGNQNALQSKRKGQPVLNMENIISSNPDMVILLAHSMNEKELTEKDLIEPWLKLPINASKYHAIYIENRYYAGVPSDRLVLFLRDFKNFLIKFKNREKALFN
jgi:iron complex transport system substrate-binding protein